MAEVAGSAKVPKVRMGWSGWDSSPDFCSFKTNKLQVLFFPWQEEDEDEDYDGDDDDDDDDDRAFWTIYEKTEVVLQSANSTRLGNPSKNGGS